MLFSYILGLFIEWSVINAGSSLASSIYENEHIEFLHNVNPETVIIRCKTIHSWANLPSDKIDFYNYRNAILRNCTFSESDNILNILKSLNLKILWKLWFEQSQSIITKKNIHGLNLKELSFSYGQLQLSDDLLYDNRFEEINFEIVDFQTIPDNFFKKSSNLLSLGLLNTTIKKIKQNDFVGLTNLEYLLIMENDNVEIEPGAFDSLLSLKILEIESNKIINLPSGLFKNLKEIEDLDLNGNEFNELPSDLFADNSRLLQFKMSRNRGKMKTLPPKFFKNLSNLENIDLSYDNFSSIPEDLFFETTLLAQLDFSNNNLKILPPRIFINNKELKTLKLSKNKITWLLDDIFENTNIENLDLSYNQIVLLPITIENKNLKILDISYNKVNQIYKNLCRTAKNLEIFRASHNQLKIWDTPGSFLVSCHKIVEIDLSYNRISTIRDSELSTRSLQTVNLDGNLLYKVDATVFIRQFHPQHWYLQNNSIFTIDFKNISWIAKDRLKNQVSIQQSVFYMNNNPLNCNCKILDYLYFFEHKLDKLVEGSLSIVANDLRCAAPLELEGRLVSTLSSRVVKCPVDCSELCDCSEYPGMKILKVDCSNRSLSYLPNISIATLELVSSKNYRVELDLSRNQFTETPPISKYPLPNVTFIDLSVNQISRLTLEIFPDSLKKLNLNNNNLSFIDSTIINYLKNLTTLDSIIFFENTWRCECKDLNFIDLVRNNPMIFGPSNNFVCPDKSRKFSTISPNDLCPISSQLIVIGASFLIALLVAIIGCLAALYYKYESEIKIWLYSKQWCLWLVTEDELDKDKLYDAFISFSHKDEDFVKEIVEKLENESQPYKFCRHDRDWEVGAWIPVQIEESIQNSRRTIIILSQNFIESYWSRQEFFSAHKQALVDRRARVIIVRYGDIDDTENLDQEIKMYLKLNTYLNWDDPKFYDKLRYALPHRHSLSKFREKSRKNRAQTKKLDELYLDYVNSLTNGYPTELNNRERAAVDNNVFVENI